MSQREAVEELLELLWTADEDDLLPLDRHRLPQSLRCFLPHPIEENGGDLQRTIEEAIQQGLVEIVSGVCVQLSLTGRQTAEPVVRRHRLTESLLAGVLDVSEASMESTACQMEHILNVEVTDAVCTFLGHPPVCPHGRSIPRGVCCQRAEKSVAPLLVPLGQLAVGAEGAVAFIHTGRSAYRQRLSLLGLMPGRRLRVKQVRPTLVIAVGETELALDREAGQEIFVRRR
ncbi:MAG: metal-dependent transcriptional regulator [Candidatus Omnitrophica bacterium]|nr:metal-dependent transcriptional regulator [Candidatus Omnitrophota bacterium]